LTCKNLAKHDSQIYDESNQITATFPFFGDKQ